MEKIRYHNILHTEKIRKLNQELILSHDDLIDLSYCIDDEELDYLIDLYKNHPIVKRPKKIESYDFNKSKQIEKF